MGSLMGFGAHCTEASTVLMFHLPPTLPQMVVVVLQFPQQTYFILISKKCSFKG